MCLIGICCVCESYISSLQDVSFSWGACDPSSGEVEAEDGRLEASQGYIQIEIPSQNENNIPSPNKNQRSLSSVMG